MIPEAPIPSSLEAQVRELAEEPIPKTARETAVVIRKALEAQSGETEFSLVSNGEPFFNVNLVSGGTAGLNIGLAYLKEDGAFEELFLKLRYSGNPFKEKKISWENYLAAFAKSEKKVVVDCSFNTNPKGKAPSIVEDPTTGKVTITIY
jgi:hypothetical protein